MKMTFKSTSSLTIVGIVFLLSSCAGVQKMQESVMNSREKDHKAFVEKTDGEIIEANEAKLRSPLFGKSTIELDNEVKIPLKEVAAYQNNSAYYHSTPNGFAPRIKKGLINVYMASYSYTTYEVPSGGGAGRTRNNTRYIYYLQKGNGSKLESMSPKTIETYVSDYAPAMDFINQYNQTQKKVSTWSIINTAAVFGGMIMAGSIGLDKQDNVTAAGYGGLGLFFGGLVNGVVNKIRRVKNARNLELAVDAYNYQTVKKKK